MIRCLGAPSVPGPSGSPPLGPVRPCGARTRVTTQTAVQLVEGAVAGGGDWGSFLGHFSLAVASGYGVLLVK